MNENLSQEPALKFLDGALTKTQSASDAANALLKSGLDTVVQTSQQVSESVHTATAKTTHFIREEPIKSVLIAAATGAVLMALVGLVSRPSERS